MSVKKEVLIQGVGVSQFRDLSGNRICNFLKNDSLQLSHKQNYEMVRFGDSVFATMSFLRDAEGSVQMNSVMWDWDFAKMVAGSSNVQTGQASTFEEIGEMHTVVSAAFTLKKGAALQAESDKLYYVSDGTPLTRVADAPIVGQYTIGATGACGFNAADEGKEIYCDYTRAVTGIVVMDMKKTSMPPYGQLIHTGRVIGKDSSAFQYVQTKVYKCRFNGELVLNFQQGQATSPQLTLQILDPERDDDKIFTMKFAE